MPNFIIAAIAIFMAANIATHNYHFCPPPDNRAAVTRTAGDNAK